MSRHPVLLTTVATTACVALCTSAAATSVDPLHTSSSQATATDIEDHNAVAKKTPKASLKQTYVEGSQTFQWNDQKHHVMISGGKIMHAWTAGGQKHSSQIGKAGYVGTPVAFMWDNEQHYFARTDKGAIKHHQYDPKKSWQEEEWVASGAKYDPAAGSMSNRQHLFYVDDNHRLQHVWRNPNGSTHLMRNNWSSLAEASGAPEVKLVGRPSIMKWEKQEHVFVRTIENDIAHFYWDPKTNKIRYYKWGKEKSITDVSAMATKDNQLVYYVNPQGRLKLLGWNRHTGYMSPEDWSRDGDSATEAAIIGRPQVFGHNEWHHVFAPRNDGSVRHYFRGPGKPIDHNTWLAAGSTDQPISAALLKGEQNMFLQTIQGNRQRAWYSTSEKTVKREDFGGWLATTTPRLDPLTEPQVSHHSAQNGHHMYLSVAYPGARSRVFISRDPELFPAGFTASLAHETDHTPAGSRVMWGGKDGKTYMSGVQDTGQLRQTSEKIAGQVDFADTWTPTLLGATGGIAAVNLGTEKAPANRLVATTETGLVTALVEGDGPTRWQHILRRPGLSEHVAVEDIDNNSAKIFARTTDGKLKVGIIDRNSNVSGAWSDMPELPSKKPITGKVASTRAPNGAAHVAVTDEAGKVFVASFAAGATTSAWRPVSDTAITGSPDIISTSNRGIVVTGRDKDKKALFSTSTNSSDFTEFEPARPKVGAGVTLNSDPVLVVPQGTGSPEWAIVGVNEAGNLVAAFRPKTQAKIATSPSLQATELAFEVTTLTE